VILHTDELRPTVLLGDELESGELSAPHTGGADIAHFTAFDQVVESGHGFFRGSVGVESVDLEEVDVGCV